MIKMIKNRKPTMIAMVKAWITKEYTLVSPNIIVCLVGAILYLLKRKDLISDRIRIFFLLLVRSEGALISVSLKNSRLAEKNRGLKTGGVL